MINIVSPDYRQFVCEPEDDLLVFIQSNILTDSQTKAVYYDYILCIKLFLYFLPKRINVLIIML